MDKDMILIGLTHAGGNSDFFRSLFSRIKGEMDGFAPEYAGHQSRNREACYDDWAAMTEDLSATINRAIAGYGSYCIFGYSIGSIIMYELLAGDMLDRSPEHIFIASHSAPHVEWRSKGYYDMDEEAFMERMKKNGGFDRVDDRMMRNPHFRKLYLDPLRSDYRLIRDYRMSSFKKLPAEATLMYASQDITDEAIHSWDRYLTGDSRYYRFDGNHFFMNDNLDEVTEIIMTRYSILKGDKNA